MSVFDIRVGDKVTGKYIGETLVTGTVRDLRMRYYELIFYVDLDTPIEVRPGTFRDGVILSEKELLV